MRKVLVLVGLFFPFTLWAQKQLVSVPHALQVSASKPLVAIERAASVSTKIPSGIFPAELTSSAAHVSNVQTAQIRSALERIFQQQKQQNKELAQRNYAVMWKIDKLWSQNEDITNSLIFEILHEPLTEPSFFSLQNNKIVLVSGKNIIERANWLRALPNQGRDKLGIAVSPSIIREWAVPLSKQDMIFLAKFIL